METYTIYTIKPQWLNGHDMVVGLSQPMGKRLQLSGITC